jgi:hypothetical protein
MENQKNEVREDCRLHDTILIGSGVPHLEFNTGWVDSYSELGRLSKLNFFNVRNRPHGLAFNNQDSVDQTPYKLEISKIHVHFFAGPLTQRISGQGEIPAYEENTSNGLFQYDLENHCGMRFYISKDERLATPAIIAGAGVGIVGGGASNGIGVNPQRADYHLIGQAGIPELKNGFPFPQNLIIPERATFYVELEFSEYARGLLQVMAGPDHVLRPNQAGTAYDLEKYTYSGIRVSIAGKRTVVQRGEARS